MDTELIKFATAIIALLTAVALVFKPTNSAATTTADKTTSVAVTTKRTRFKTGIILASLIMITALTFVRNDWHTFVVCCCATMIANIVIVTCYYE